ncbi:unnamed protein product [Owenia fusiformis]|uniref:non-specific serine/threonine protein kinase n=1 Tax=Owenia fusiformis TaxID=6347 RepID=A0A8J1XXD1_OWEFU|nr:unnamed protein product [Owenia fusiformis]
MSSDENFSERQEEEVQVLQAIFMDDVKDLRAEDAWKIRRPPEIKMTLVPQQSMHGEAEVYAQIDLIIKCPARYPNEVPSITLENQKGLSSQLVQELQDTLTKKAEELKGEVMILELANEVQQFLHTYNKPPAASFYEQMLHNQRLKEQQAAVEQQRQQDLLNKKEQRERKHLEEEIERHQKALREETRRQREEAKHDNIETQDDQIQKVKDAEARSSLSPIMKRNRTRSETNSNQRYNSSSRTRGDSNGSDGMDSDPHLGTAVLAFNTNKKERTIHRGRCLGQSRRGSCVYAGMDTQTGDLVAIAEWVFRWRRTGKKLTSEQKEDLESEAAKYLKQVRGIEAELMTLSKLEHRHIVHYAGLKYEHQGGRIVVNILMDYVGGGSLETHLQHNMPLSVDLLRHYTIEILDALVFLHDKAVVHKDLRASSILLDNKSRVRLTDFSIDKRLYELCQSVESERPGVKFQELRPHISGRGGKKSDIYKLGIVLLSLVEGRHVLEQLPEVPTHLPIELQDFLTKCLINDEKHRSSAHDLQEHVFVKSPLPLNLQSHGTRQSPERDDAKACHEDEEEEMPIILHHQLTGHSRLESEFTVLKFLGKGGFGDVIKVKNKLDDRSYAIKRIPLNPKSKIFTRKITREVKLLSRLNHENVVRYYNSWIETSDEPAFSESSSSGSSPTKTPTDSSKHEAISNKMSSVRNSLGLKDDFANLPPAAESVDWSTSDIGNVPDDESSSSEEEDIADVFGHSSLFHDEDSDSDGGIVFEHNSAWNIDTEESKDAKLTEESSTDTSETVPKLQYLYIQMEYCEKSTLRNCIDAGLYEDMNRVWRLFREIIEGLVHIHQQGMIHRDLKPVNIFLDSNDQVKIGDFGLATTDIISKQQGSIMETNMQNITGDSQGSASGSLGQGSLLGEGSLTGKVGTALYVSPEMMLAKAQYSQKVDIYSLGVMFFEMCYHPLPTGMERIQVLTNIRRKTIDFPDDFDEFKLSNQAKIIKTLLNHDHMLRPSAQDLLQSEYLPPPQREEAELNEVLRSTISNPQSRIYKHMLTALFDQPVSAAVDFTYDNDIHKGHFSTWSALLYSHVQGMLERVFQKHGAVQVVTPLLMPKCDVYKHIEQYVCLMDRSGGMVGLPFDLRVSFARYVARNNITNLKRYHIGRVFREKKLFGLHPKELIECTYDIVSPNNASLLPDSEILHVVSEIIAEVPSLSQRNFTLRLNHISLLRGVLLHCGVGETLHKDVKIILNSSKADKQKKQQIQNRLQSLGLTEQTITQLYHFIEMEGTFSKISSILRCITKTKGLAGSYAKKGLHELEAILSHVETLGVKLPVVLSLGLVYNVHYYSGLVFEVSAQVVRKKRHVVLDVLAAGGRYDDLIKNCGIGTSDTHQGAVGVSLGMEKIVAAVGEQDESKALGAYDILVCTLGHKSMIKEKLSVVRDLWAAGLKANILLDTSLSLEEILENCRQSHVSHIVIMKDTAEGSTIKVKSLEKDRVTEKKMAINELTEYLQQKIQQSDQRVTSEKQESSKPVSQPSQVLTDTLSGGSSNTHNQSIYNITFITLENMKLAGNAKRKYESQMYAKLLPFMQNLTSKCRIEIVMVDLPFGVLKTIAGNLELDADKEMFDKSIGPIVEKHQRYRKYFTKIFDHIFTLKFDDKCPVIMLYSMKDDSHRILVS